MKRLLYGIFLAISSAAYATTVTMSSTYTYGVAPLSVPSISITYTGIPGGSPSYNIDYGDGAGTGGGGGPATNGTSNGSHIYTTPGAYQINGYILDTNSTKWYASNIAYIVVLSTTPTIQGGCRASGTFR